MNGGFYTSAQCLTNIKYTEDLVLGIFRRKLPPIPYSLSSKPLTIITFSIHGRPHSASKRGILLQPTTFSYSSSSSSLASTLGNDEEEFEESEENNSGFDSFSIENERAYPDDYALIRRQNARSLAILNMSSSTETTDEEHGPLPSEENRLELAMEENISRKPKFPGMVNGVRVPSVEEFFREGKGGSEWENQMLRQALTIRRMKTEEVLKQEMRASKLSVTYSNNLVSEMSEFVDHIMIKAASLKNKSDFATSTFHLRARLCIQQSGVVELVKWLKHNRLTYPRIGKLVGRAAEDLGNLKLLMQWLKSIHVKGRDLGVVLTRVESIMRRPIQELDHNVQFLECHGVKLDWMGFVVSRCPEILSFSMEELKWRVDFFLELGMNDEDFGTMVFEYPKVIGFFSIEDMINKVNYLREFGLDNTDLARIIAVRPHILGCNVEEGWKPLVKYLYYLGVPRSGMRRLLTLKPSIFCLNLTENIAPKVRFLRAIGVHEEAIGGVLVKFPALLTYSLYKKTRPVVKFLLETAGVSESDIGKVIATEPELIGCSISGKLEVTTKYFLALGIAPQILGRMIADFPMLLKYNVSVLRPKYRYLKRVMVRPLQDVIEFPRFFSYSLNSRIIPRHKILVENGLNFKLRYMLASSDEEFTQRIQAALGNSQSLEVSDLELSGTHVEDCLQSSEESYGFESLEKDKC
eukprot:Gb_07758 [translate_table: standard]